MKILILQIEDRNDSKLNNFMNYNKLICNKYNIEYIYKKKSRVMVPPYWGKIYEIYEIMKEKPSLDYIMWLDSDAFFFNYNNDRFHNFIKKYSKYSMIFTKDMPPWRGEFNAGVFIIKNDEIGQNIIKEWLSHYNPNNWKYENMVWTTNTKWAGDSYEQGSFIKYIKNNNKFINNIIQLPYFYLNNNNCENNTNDTITVHLAAFHKNNYNTIYKCLRKNKMNISHDYFTFTNYNTNTIDIYKILKIIILFILLFVLVKKLRLLIKY